jgi:hypothetical protein
MPIRPNAGVRALTTGTEQDKDLTLTRTQQPSPVLQRKDRFNPRLPSHPGGPQGKGDQGEGDQGEGDHGVGLWGCGRVCGV